MKLPTPEEMVTGALGGEPFMTAIDAIRADRAAIARVVEEKAQYRQQPGRISWTIIGYKKACEEILDLLRPNKKGEPPLDDSPTAPLR